MSTTAPVVKDEWSYSGSDFYVRASGQHSHRRATIPELKALFRSSSKDGEKDPVAHWYEAQLMHYGLPPSKVKGTAKMRLMDAVQGGNLTVPAHIKKIEAGLKREWAKSDRESKLKSSSKSTPMKSVAGTKRKADFSPAVGNSGPGFNLNLSLSVAPNGTVIFGGPIEPASKKARTAVTKASGTSTTKTAATDKKTVTDKKAATVKKTATPQKTMTPKKTAADKKSATDKKTVTSKKPATATKRPSASYSGAISSRPAVPTARRGGLSSSTSGCRGGAATSSASRSQQTSAADKQHHRGGPIAYANTDAAYDDPPPPYPGSPYQDYGDGYDDYDDDSDYYGDRIDECYWY